MTSEYLEFLDFIENNLSQKGYLKIENIEFSKKSNKLFITLLFDDNFKELFLQEKSKIIENTRLYLDGCDFEIVFKKSYLDVKYLQILIKKEIEEANSNIVKNIPLIDCKISKKDDCFDINIKLDLDEKLKSFYDDFFNSLIQKYSIEYFYKFNLNIQYVNKEIDYIKDFEEKLLQQQDETEEDIEEFLNIESEKIILYGTKIENNPLKLEFLNKDLKNVCTCGKVTNIREKEQIKKDEEGNVKESKKFYLFKLSYGKSILDCAFFPKKADREKPLMIQENDDVIIEGVLDEYRDSLSLSAKNITLCTLPEFKEEPIKILPVPKEYKSVFPEKFEKYSQFDIFSLLDNKTTNDFILNNSFIVFDVETTGLNVDTEMLTEISAIKIEKGIMVEQFSTLINPEIEIPKKIVELTHITDDMVKDCPKISEVIADFNKFCEGSIMVAYNSPFDMAFINRFAKANCYEFKNEVIDALVLARDKLPGLSSYKLKNVASKLNVSLIGAHRAINDTLATAEVFLKLYEIEN